jgi:hypothetical protein
MEGLKSKTQGKLQANCFFLGTANRGAYERLAPKRHKNPSSFSAVRTPNHQKGAIIAFLAGKGNYRYLRFYYFALLMYTPNGFGFDFRSAG